MMKGSKLRIGVIVPCFNEGTRILPVIKTIFESKFVDEIIVVDDGSSEPTKTVLGTLPKKVRVIIHKKNGGKASAMKTGLLNIKSEIVVFVDADLRGFSEDNLKNLIEPIKNGEADMVLGVREFDVFYARVFGMSAPYSGERSFRRETLLKNIGALARGYTVEAALNKIYFRKYRTSKVLMRGVGQTAKMKKDGIRGMFASMRMTQSIIKFIGLREALFQMSFVMKMKYYRNR